MANKSKHRAIVIHPLYIVLISFIILILLGSFVLMLPVSANVPVGFIDALFTSTSAVCVTGLIVFDTAKDFTVFGRAVILTLIQFGGFGIMTFSLGLISLFGKDLSVKWRYTLKGFYSESGNIPVTNILIRVIKYTFFFESITALLLFWQFRAKYTTAAAIGHSVFHAVSAFCNAGFSTFSDNLLSFQSNFEVLIVVSFAIIAGGIGFIVISEISALRYRFTDKESRKAFLFSLHTKIVLIMTFFLIVSGATVFYMLERHNTLANMTFIEAVINSIFQSITCRTAGFNSVDISATREVSQLLMIPLMFIGGSPGSIAGGIKTTTFFAVMLFVFSKTFQKRENSIFKRTLDEDTVSKSIFVFILAILIIFLSVFVMLVFSPSGQKGQFLPVLYETVSAFGTVGLSTGITPGLSVAEKIVLIFVMLAGRLGLFTVIMMIGLRYTREMFSYPREQIMVG